MQLKQKRKRKKRRKLKCYQMLVNLQLKPPKRNMMKKKPPLKPQLKLKKPLRLKLRPKPSNKKLLNSIELEHLRVNNG